MIKEQKWVTGFQDELILRIITHTNLKAKWQALNEKAYHNICSKLISQKIIYENISLILSKKPFSLLSGCGLKFGE